MIHGIQGIFSPDQGIAEQQYVPDLPDSRLVFPNILTILYQYALRLTKEIARVRSRA
jgi:hypothetical protein